LNLRGARYGARMENEHGVRRPFWRKAFLILGFFSVGCVGQIGGGEVGQVQLALTLPDSTTIDSVAWKVLSSTNTVMASGTLNTSGTRMASFISSLAASTGDTVNMTATTSGGVACAGTSTAFDVVAGQATMVNVNITCDGSGGGTGNLGSIEVSATVVPGDQCPTLTGWFITPQSTTGSNPIDVSVTASDADVGDTVTFAWTATSGTFASATSAMTQYTCAGLGSQTLSVAISDNHMPTPCTTHVTFPTVSCQ
jgi:hypothetical protein